MTYETNYLAHHGIKGQKWGVRRFQNSDGTWTSAGKQRYGDGGGDAIGSYKQAKASYKQAKKEYNKAYDKASGYSTRHMISQFVSKKHREKSDALWDEAGKKYENASKAKQDLKNAKKAAKAQSANEQARWKQERKDYIATKSTGRNVANFLLNGPVGAYEYNSLRAAGNSRLHSEAVVVTSHLLAGPLGGAAVSTLVGSDHKEKHYRNK